MLARSARFTSFAWSFALLAVLAVLPAAPLAGQEADATELLRQLETGEYEQRQEAVKKLEALGEAARPALEKALADCEVLEVRDVAERLLESLARATILFEVLDQKGRPLAGQELDANINSSLPDAQNRGGGRQEAKKLTTDADGRALVKGYRPGPYSINVNWKERPPWFAGRTIYNLYLQRRENRVQYILGAGGKISGKVIAAGSGKPVNNAQAYLIADRGQDIRGEMEQAASGRWSSVPNSSTDAQGAFIFERVAPGAYRVGVLHDDFTAEVGELVRVAEGGVVELAAPIKLNEKNVRAGAIQVTVLNAAGEPLKKSAVLVETTRIPAPEEWAEELQAWQRRLQQNRGMQNAAWPETDEKGVLEVKDLAPGTYRVVVRAKDAAPRVFPEVKIAAGQNAALEARGPGPAGSIKGKVSMPAPWRGAGTQVLALAVEDPRARILVQFSRQGAGWFWMLRNQFRQDAPEAANANQEGNYELKTLCPGRYVLLYCLPMGRMGIVYGVEVKEGQQAQAPDVSAPGIEGAQAQTSYKGAVVTQDGKPVPQAMVQIWSGWSGSGTQSNADGSFQVQVGMQVDVEGCSAISVTAAGYRPKIIDLAKEKMDLQNLLIRLEPQAYGRLRLTIKDPAGKPLENAWVTPFSNRSRQPDGSRTRGTNAQGVATLAGLAYGTRQVDVALDGYYGPTPLDVEIAANQEREAELTLTPCLSVKGRVELPPDADARRALVLVRETNALPNQGELWRTYPVDAQGRFACTGLRPGAVDLYPQYPGFMEEQAAHVELKDANTPEVTLKLVRPGGLRFELGPERHGVTLRLVEPGTWDPLKPPKPSARAAWMAADSTGRAEASNVAPGRYEVLVRAPKPETGNGGPRREGLAFSGMPSGGPKDSVAEVVQSALDVPSLPGGAADLEKTPAHKLELAAMDGAARGRVAMQMDEVKGRNLQYIGLNGNLTLTVVGAQAFATVTFGVPHELNPAQAPIVIGKALEGWEMGQPGEFSIAGLPPGEYRLFVAFKSYSYMRSQTKRGGQPAEDEQAPTLLKTFKVEKGETADLGEIPFELPKAALEQATRDRRQQMLMGWGGEAGDDEPVK
jgi:protocatechuate 3,4-dioxygenase beta subunit